MPPPTRTSSVALGVTGDVVEVEVDLADGPVGMILVGLPDTALRRHRYPGGQPGNDTGSSAAGSHLEHRLFGQAIPGPEPSLRAPATFTQATPAREPSEKKIQRAP
jgi:hypothetical protein